MLDTLRISAGIYKEMFEYETRSKNPGHVEVIVEYFATDDRTGEQDRFSVVLSQGTPEQAHKLAER